MWDPIPRPGLPLPLVLSTWGKAQDAHVVPAVVGEAGEGLWGDEVEPEGGEAEEDVPRAAKELHETVHGALVGGIGPGTRARDTGRGRASGLARGG